MSDHIPFITGQDAAKLAAKFYGDSEFARVSLDKANTLASQIPKNSKLWIDPAIDGLDDINSRRGTNDRPNNWYQFQKTLPNFEQIADSTFWVKPNAQIVNQFVVALLNKCIEFKPAWISVPQLPNVGDSSRNKINRALAKAAGSWKSSRNFSGRMILPLIFTNQNQLNGKTERNPQIKQAGLRYHEAQADGLWVVDNSLTDDSGSKTLRNSRFPGLVQFHQELNDEIPCKLRVAGPYWGLNVLLWARGLVDYPAIGIGNSYQYFLAGGHATTPTTRLAISSLRRRVGVAGLATWLDDAISKIGTNHPLAPEFSQARKQIQFLTSPENAREQVAKFYKIWLDLIAASPKTGRALALFQDLSAAYAFGKALPDLNKDEGTARKPESVAEPLMLNCL